MLILRVWMLPSEIGNTISASLGSIGCFPEKLRWCLSEHMLQLMREDCSYAYPPLSIARYSFIQLSELDQCRVKKLPQGFNTAAQDSNPGSLSRESDAIPLSHGALRQIGQIMFASKRVLFAPLYSAVVFHDDLSWNENTNAIVKKHTLDYTVWEHLYRLTPALRIG